LLEKCPRKRETEPELRELLERAVEPVERGSVGALRDPFEDRKVPLHVKIRTAGTEVKETKSSESPGLVEVEVEHDLQGRTPPARIASR